ncbi:MAG: outer membrane beta-barrel protein [Paludibacteraceae bacterium]|jgi:hypothetical protein|nr:porin family protein [Bacteroidales bacterium]MBO5131918.1 outer membrane beta-barrel protein [Paludibacteraceae bacterium]MBO5829440.1 outer membrane beta-barrel protein [Paludibacteraceae bacterium]
MKKLAILVACTLLLAGHAYAQDSSRDIILSGNIGISYDGADRVDDKKNGTSTFTLDIGPQLLFGITDKFYLGAEVFAHLNYYNEYENGDKIDNGHKNMFGIAPTARLYAFKWKLFGFFCDMKIGFSAGTDNDKTVFTAFSAGISPGMEFFMGNNWSLAASFNNLLSYTLENANPKSGSSYRSSEFNFRVNPMEMDYAPLKLTLSYHF